MTYQTTALTAGANETQAAIDAGTAIAKPAPLDDEGRFYSTVVPAGAAQKTIDLEDLYDKRRDRPRRKTGVVRHDTATSFIHYVDKHGLPETETWADLNTSTITAVINAHDGINDRGDTEGPAGWGDHRAILQLQKTPAWTTWLANDKKPMNQATFAEFIEDNQVHIQEPAAATMLEIAQSIQAATSVTFESGTRLSTGEVHLVYREDTDAKAGRKGDLTIPQQFTVLLQPYQGTPHYRVPARFRYRLNNGDLLMSYALDRPEDVLELAFNETVAQIAEETERTVMHGKPA
ncbi:DUF2303 family protein [Phytoactinopolyspora limicola]|uniref:DUF2303 family protein n=1 Tax=Phytoactinopolyspora limicola TaxID=2715536 RepID=UPI00140D542A|nr:DUF2303 family protein [Phytoactinopolyspora limicola]